MDFTFCCILLGDLINAAAPHSRFLRDRDRDRGACSQQRLGTRAISPG